MQTHIMAASGIMILPVTYPKINEPKIRCGWREASIISVAKTLRMNSSNEAIESPAMAENVGRFSGGNGD